MSALEDNETNSENRIRVSVDLSEIEGAIHMHHQVLNLQSTGFQNELPGQFIENRRRILLNLVRLADHWQSLLATMNAIDSADSAKLEAVKARIADFRTWAEHEIAILGTSA